MEVILKFNLIYNHGRHPFTIMMNNSIMSFCIKDRNILEFSTVYGKYISLSFASDIECAKAYEFVSKCITDTTYAAYRFEEKSHQ